MAYIDNVTNILQIQPDGLPTFVRLSQNENGRNLYFQLAGNEIDIPRNATVTISGTKPDGNVYSGTGSVTDNVVLIPEMMQMTAVAGTWDAKVKITSGGNTIATGRVRFIVDADTVAPGSVPSSSELEGLVAEAQQYAETARTEAYGSPLTAQTAAGMTDHTRVYVYTGSETGYTAGHWYYWNGSAWTDGGIYNSVAVNTDPTLTLTGVAADAKATGDAIAAARVAVDDTLSNTGEAADAKVVGDELTALKSDLDQAVDDLEQEIADIEPGLSQEAKQALLACFENVAWTTGDGQTYYDNLHDALYPETALVRLDAVFTQGDTKIYTSTPLDILKPYLVVTGHYSDGTTKTIQDYALSGTLTAGTSTVTVSKDGITTTFTVLVTAWMYEWEYADGLPNENGMQIQTTGTYTAQIANDGLNVTTENVAAGIVRYKYPSYYSPVYMHGAYELEFVVNSWGSYNNYPYGNGVRLNAGLGERGGSYVKCAELCFNQSGISYMKAGVSWTMIDTTPINLNTLYKVRVEQSTTSADVYLNDRFLATIDDFYEEVGYPQFIVNRGASAKFKSYRLRLTTD